MGVLGVGVTPRQLETAARFSPSRRVVLARDADAAGDAAVRRLCDDVLPTLSQVATSSIGAPIGDYKPDAKMTRAELTKD